MWLQPASIVVTEAGLRSLYGIADDVRLEDLEPPALSDMIGEAILRAPDHWVELEEDWREVDPVPYPDSPSCRCGHWLLLDTDWGSGHPPPRSWVAGETFRPCRACGCQHPERQPDPPWVRHG
jgi:hypothetical protein